MEIQLQFNVNGQFIKRVGELEVVADSQKQISLKFVFSAEWNGTTKTALITTNKITYKAVLNSEGIATVEKVPVLKSGLCYFSVYAGELQDDVALITANEEVIDVKPSGLKEGILPEILIPDKLEQLQTIIGNLETALTAILGV